MKSQLPVNKIPKMEAEIIYKIIEVDKTLGASDWTKEDEEAIQTLKNQPGYLALLKKIRLRKAFIDNSLQSARYDSLVDFANTQAWSQCLRWVEGSVRADVEKHLEKPRSAYALEEEAFESISKAMKFVGQKV